MKKRYLITSALPYINGIKHLGTLVGSMLPADVCARFLRQKGEEVLFICATDEHGTPAELAAAEEKMTVEEYCKKYHDLQKKSYDGFRLSFDHFGRTSNPQNIKLTQHFCEKLIENGMIEKRTMKQIYSHADGRFLPDRYIVGTCPYCGYDKARGDQCDKCTRLLDPTDLINPRSAVSGSTDLELKETSHLFLQLNKKEKELKEWIDEKEGIWPPIVISIARKWLKEGLQERCITRDLKWGVPVNYEGMENKVFYVWFDAPIGYIASTQEWVDEDPEHRSLDYWWKESDDVCYIQFMGKDNVAFHSISFPASLMGTGENWKKVDILKGVNWLNYYGGKFSTSQHRGVFTDTALEEFAPDYWRYWLMANVPESDDVSFSVDSFASVINKDLNDVLGNFVNRVLKMTEKNFGDTVPEGGEWGEEEKTLSEEINKTLTDYTKSMEKLEFRKALGYLRELWVIGNNYVARTEPWKAVKEDKNRGAVILRTALNLVRIYGHVSAPIIPDSAEKMRNIFGGEKESWATVNDLTFLKGGEKIIPTEPLFEKILPERIAELEERYGGAVEQ